MRHNHLADLTPCRRLPTISASEPLLHRSSAHPSALSSPMRQLEDHLGVRCCTVTTRSVSPPMRVAPAAAVAAVRWSKFRPRWRAQWERERPFGRLRSLRDHLAVSASSARLDALSRTYPDVASRAIPSRRARRHRGDGFVGITCRARSRAT